MRLDDGSEARLNNLCQTLGISQSEVVKAGLVLLRQQLSDQHRRERQVGRQP